jgi:hypothetical protein
MLADLYSKIASRSMERIFLSPDPLSNDASMKITSGSSSDIQQATAELWTMLYNLGFDPKSGTLFRNNAMGMPQEFQALPPDQVMKLGQILKDMEDHMVKEFLAAHKIEWYKERIVTLARAEGMTEAQFYELIGYSFPGENNSEGYDRKTRLAALFGGAMEASPKEVEKARNARQGENKTTAAENLDLGAATFMDSIERNLHANEIAKKSIKNQLLDPTAEGVKCFENLLNR